MNSPRSLEACRQLGIIPNELYFQDFETYIKLNPEVIALPKDFQKMRFENIDNYRRETIKMVIEQREKIINNQNEIQRNNDYSENLNTYNNITPTKINIEMNTNTNNDLNGTTNMEEKQLPIYNLDEQLNSMLEKEKKNIEKLKRRQKNEIETELENKIKSVMIRQKAELKEKRIQQLNEKLQEKLEDQARKEEQKRIEKEKRREED